MNEYPNAFQFWDDFLKNSVRIPNEIAEEISDQFLIRIRIGIPHDSALRDPLENRRGIPR